MSTLPDCAANCEIAREHLLNRRERERERVRPPTLYMLGPLQLENELEALEVGGKLRAE